MTETALGSADGAQGNRDGFPPPPGTDRHLARILGMGTRKTATEIFSWTTIGLSLALLAGMALGDLTRQAMHARLYAPLAADPVERDALGQNAYKMPHVPARTTPVQPAHHTGAGYEIGRYQKGVRILAPQEPARKADRLRLKRLQAWSEGAFGSDTGYPEVAGEGKDPRDVYAPINVGAVRDAPEMAAMSASGA
ncbi:hypothetical protein [Sphingorhabdus sp. 109]|uniref:hypothetical protein n=1 Tax=Sphingorhabdus sp. 109 TaxID=2653173 RepID=UPI00135CAAE1|nr:hypothetical protein [Sphingorhabdus sp. 109]